MLQVEHIQTAGWEPALRGMRNPLDSWDKADSEYPKISAGSPIIGPNDESLMRRLIGQGSSDHCKFRRMIAIWCDVTAPLYWHKEMDTYKVGTVENSCSTMHTLMKEPFTEDMFSWDGVSDDAWKRTTLEGLNDVRIESLELLRRGYDTDGRRVWRELIQKLPSSWNQRRTLMLNYEVMANIYRARRHHKLKEWHDFIDAMLEALPYPWIFTGRGC